MFVALLVFFSILWVSFVEFQWGPLLILLILVNVLIFLHFYFEPVWDYSCFISDHVCVFTWIKPAPQDSLIFPTQEKLLPIPPCGVFYSWMWIVFVAELLTERQHKRNTHTNSLTEATLPTLHPANSARRTMQRSITFHPSLDLFELL